MAEKRKNTKKVPNLRFPGFKEEWQSYTLGEIAEFSKGKGISKNDIDENGKTECIRYGELYTHYTEVITEIKSKTNVEKENLTFSTANDVIIPSSGETQIDIATASCVLKSGVALGGDLNIIRTLHNGVFLSYYLNSRKKIEIANLAQGISVVHLYSKQLATLKLNLPTSSEQMKIASLLSQLDNRISTQNKIIEGLELLKNTISKEILNQKWRFKDPTGHDFPDWKIKKLKDVCEIVGGGTPETNKAEYWNGKIQWFTPTEIKSIYVSKSERTITESGLKNSSAKLLPKGAILLTTRATIGEVAIAKEECTTNQGFQSLIAKEGYNNVFIFNWIKKNKYELAKRANGSTFMEVSKSEIEKIEIAVPNYDEQTIIANFLSTLDKKIELEKEVLAGFEKIKHYLLTVLFI